MASVARATYKLQVAWSAYNLGAFSFDFSTFDGTDTLGVSPLDQSFGGPYDDVSQWFRGGTWKRGSDDNLKTLLPGAATFELRDPDNRFNPNNPSSPLYGQIESRLHPCQLTGTLAGVTYPLFYGWVRGDQAKPGNRRSFATLTCVDLFYWTDRVYPVIASTGQTTTGTAIGLILDAVGWTDPRLRDLDVGDVIPDFSADGTVTATKLIEGLLLAERGMFFHAATGKATYRSRLRAFQGAATGTIVTTSLPLLLSGPSTVIAFGPAASVGTITDRMSDIEPNVDFDLLQNRVTVTRTQTGYSAVKVDQGSANRIGYSDLQAINTPYLLDDSQADDLASWILSQVASPKPPIYDLTIDNREAGLLTQALAREITDRVTIVESAADTSGDFVLQQLAHTIDENGGHTAVYVAQRPATAIPILFDTSTFDSPAVFVY